ncbi:MAG: phosphoglycerate kinase [Desulfobacterales bacterium]|nr:phosphoglycerate kinase [Desulfobacterales bacterium]MDD4071363.1 phosphoglycerate kinase [Desulfobacterales bacterium]MDD4392665.1 phosphoglycerate kinase [Desulfobacterales bacterium]
MKYLDNNLSITGKRVVIRVDFNVPLDEQGNITDDTRIRSVLPTLQYAIAHDAKLIILSHLGRPRGKVVPEMSLAPVSVRLGNLLGKDIRFVKNCIGPEVHAAVSEMNNGDVILLENLRFHAGEEQNDDAFSMALASVCDVYVNDAFAVSHRRHASVVGITKFAPVSVAGFQLKKELDYFKQAMSEPRRPVVALVGGSKVSSKLGALKNMLLFVDKLVIGGAMANTFLKSQGISVGRSKVEDDLLAVADSILKEAIDKRVKLYLPVDVVVAGQREPMAETGIVPVNEIPEDLMALDIGPATSLLYSEVMNDAGTIIWNGPMGVFEMAAFSKGTMAMARAMAESKAMTIVGGGDTDVAVHQSGETDNITYISTGGGAFLYLLEGKVLPAVAALGNG